MNYEIKIGDSLEVLKTMDEESVQCCVTSLPYWALRNYDHDGQLGQEHTPENVINIDHNVGAANTNAFKRAVNRLCNIADDVYRKEMIDYDLTDDQIKQYKEFAEQIQNEERKDKK